MVKKSFKENDIFSMKKIVILTLALYAQVCVKLDQYLFKKYGSKTLFLLFNIKEIEKVLLKCFPPRDQTNPFAYSCGFTFNTSYKNGMIGHGGERCQNAQKQFLIKTYKELILYKPVGKYHFTMACIRALVMSVYQLTNYLISQSKHMLWVLISTVAMRWFF